MAPSTAWSQAEEYIHKIFNSQLSIFNEYLIFNFQYLIICLILFNNE